ncbi:MAG TPA: GAF domain-containing protein [Pseudomonadales bacterium]|nr:GAF domain-containing protein [Pseudomonadales bacterium]
MSNAPKPLNEDERLAALATYDVLDSDPEQGTDDLVALAAGLAGTPIALISIVDAERQWFKARIGFADCETSRSGSFCAWALHSREPMIVADARRDPRFADSPIVAGEDGVRFYAGFPLWTSQDVCLGTLCVLDHEPRELAPERIALLERVARSVVAQFESRKMAAQLAEALERVRILGDLVPVCAYCRRVREDDEYRRSLESWLDEQTDMSFTHGICGECLVKAREEITQL